ncbi:MULTISPECIES: YfhE family protein [Planomicrobium]|uniref:YfhE family protein n=1 Tax=Planomicrobium okeanokoites TaxID=244 RepID=A0ABV7KJ61_PLAOK|nr:MULTISPECIES: YfhE family protein [Planomicrobium]MCM3612127.1 YfhE family protein [Planococcus sp. MER TA 32b]PKH10515.1 YfhE family protein [Planomicrobium sp. MB-3u-38]TAA68921.1 YfhE family protein [Planomicrobium okeanokoites]
MADNKQPHEKLTEKNNGLNDTQEVLYSEDFKKADKAGEQQREENDEKKKDDK